MHDRSLLGPADVDDTELTRMVAAILGHRPDDVTVLSSAAEHVAYDIPAITTAGRYWVTGTARTPDGDEPFRMFVKHVQSWSRSPLFAAVPAEIRDVAEAGVPWRTEPLAYRSDLAERLPDGLEMPRALGVFDLDELSASIWLEDLTRPSPPWDLARYARAAHLLGQLAADPRVAELARVGEHDLSVHSYLHGRLSHQVLPALADDDLWRHPLVAGSFDDDLRTRLQVAAARAPAYADELAAFPAATAHGDASPNNLLAGPRPDSFGLIDYGFWTPAPVGFDLGQLLVGDVQIGRWPPALLPETDEAILPAYLGGLAAAGLALDEAALRRAHALQLLLFTGLSTVPLEHLGEPPSPALTAIADDRATIARFVLDLVDATGG